MALSGDKASQIFSSFGDTLFRHGVYGHGVLIELDKLLLSTESWICYGVPHVRSTCLRWMDPCSI